MIEKNEHWESDLCVCLAVVGALASAPGLQNTVGREAWYLLYVYLYAYARYLTVYSSINQCADEKHRVNIRHLRSHGLVYAQVLGYCGSVATVHSYRLCSNTVG